MRKKLIRRENNNKFGGRLLKRRRQIFGSEVADFCERRRSALEKNKRRGRKEEDG